MLYKFIKISWNTVYEITAIRDWLLLIIEWKIIIYEK